MVRDKLSSNWMDDALCKNMHRLFFSTTAAHQQKAKRLCSKCPVKRECLAYALLNGEDYGVWGETNAEERRRMRTIGSVVDGFEGRQLQILNGAPALKVNGEFNFQISVPFILFSASS